MNRSWSKIDCHFISNIDKATVKYNLVDAIATACHRMGIKIVAEGIEREEELAIIMNMGIELLQGFYLSRPAPDFNEHPVALPRLPALEANACLLSLEQNFMGDIAQKADPSVPQNRLPKPFIDFPICRSSEDYPSWQMIG